MALVSPVSLRTVAAADAHCDYTEMALKWHRDGTDW